MARFRCTVCNWVYDEKKEGKPFSSLPDSYTCPVCGSPKSAFVPEGIIKGGEGIETNVADKLVEQLEAVGVKYIYGIPGDSNLPIINSLRTRKKIKFILTRHEETAAFMASAHGKMTDELGVCISIAGPGCTNLITGLMDAATDRSPVLALAGQVAEIYLGSEAFQEIDQIELFKPFTAYSETVARVNQALNVMMVAVKYAYKKPGVSVLSTPTDVLVEKLDQKICVPSKRVFKNKVLSKDEEIENAARLINESDSVVLFAGWGARHSGDLLLEIADKLKAPIATTSRAKGTINETHKYSLGVLGSIGSKHASQAIRNCDLIVIMGSGFRQANLVPANVKKIQIDMDPTRIGKTFDIDFGLVGDVKFTLEKLLPLIKEKEENREFLDGINSVRQEHLLEIEEDSKDFSIPINPGFVIQALKRNVKDDAIICCDVGDHTYWFYKRFICEGQKTFLSANMASMGFGLPAALSAQLDYPEKQVICVTGDGGFGMLMADFTTAVRENLAINVIVFNDGKLKNIKKEEERDGYPEFGVSFPNPNFAQFAQTAGGEGFRVEDPKELDEAIKKAFAFDKPAIIDVLVDPEKMAAATKGVD
jgi:pyruvate oxidase